MDSATAPLDTEWRARDPLRRERMAVIDSFTHISARVPGPEHHFLINPYGMMFEEITASNLVKIALDGSPIGESEYAVNPAGFTKAGGERKAGSTTTRALNAVARGCSLGT
jgi:hypothetical protein